jgi:hypothetical protein
MSPKRSRAARQQEDESDRADRGSLALEIGRQRKRATSKPRTGPDACILERRTSGCATECSTLHASSFGACSHAGACVRSGRSRRSDAWHSDSPAADACRTKGSVRLRAIAGSRALMDRTNSSHLTGPAGVAVIGGTENSAERRSLARWSSNSAGFGPWRGGRSLCRILPVRRGDLTGARACPFSHARNQRTFASGVELLG